MTLAEYVDSACDQLAHLHAERQDMALVQWLRDNGVATQPARKVVASPNYAAAARAGVDYGTPQLTQGELLASLPDLRTAEPRLSDLPLTRKRRGISLLRHS